MSAAPDKRLSSSGIAVALCAIFMTVTVLKVAPAADQIEPAPQAERARAHNSTVSAQPGQPIAIPSGVQTITINVSIPPVQIITMPGRGGSGHKRRHRRQH